MSYDRIMKPWMCGKAASKIHPHPPTCEFPSSNIQARGGGDVVESDVHGCVVIAGTGTSREDDWGHG